MFAAFNPKNIPAAPIVMINDQYIPKGVFNFFLPIKTSHLLYRFFSSSDLKHMTSFWWLILFFIDKFFRKSVICKKYTNTNGKDRKHTNAIDISII